MILFHLVGLTDLIHVIEQISAKGLNYRCCANTRWVFMAATLRKINTGCAGLLTLLAYVVIMLENYWHMFLMNVWLTIINNGSLFYS